MPPRSVELARTAQGVAQAAPTVSAALAAPQPPPPPPPAPATARTEPREAPRREEPKRAPKPQGAAGAKRQERKREEPKRVPPPAPTTSTMAPEFPLATDTTFRPPMADTSEQMRDAMQRVDELRLARMGERPYAGGGYAYKMPTMFRGQPSEQPARFADVKPAPEASLQSVAAFRDEVARRSKEFQEASRKMSDLDATRLVVEDMRKTEAAPPRMRTVQREATPYEAKLQELAWMIRTLKPEMAAARANLVEMGLTDEQIDQLAR